MNLWPLVNWSVPLMYMYHMILDQWYEGCPILWQIYAWHCIVLYPPNNRLTIQYNRERSNTIECNTMPCINLSEYWTILLLSCLEHNLLYLFYMWTWDIVPVELLNNLELQTEVLQYKINTKCISFCKFSSTSFQSILKNKNKLQQMQTSIQCSFHLNGRTIRKQSQP